MFKWLARLFKTPLDRTIRPCWNGKGNPRVDYWMGVGFDSPLDIVQSQEARLVGIPPVGSIYRGNGKKCVSVTATQMEDHRTYKVVCEYDPQAD